MAFSITKTTHNGYRCGCCREESTNPPTWVPTLEEALSHLPLTMPPESEDGGLYAVEIVDGTTGEKVAWGHLSWSSGYGKYSAYLFSRWSGYHPDTGAFEVLQSRDGQDLTGKTWTEVLDGLRQEYRAQQQEEAQRAADAAIAKLATFRGPPS